MAKMFITVQQAQALMAARKLGTHARKAEKKKIFAAIHAEHGIPRTTKLVFNIENPDNEQYRVIRDKRTRMPLDNGVQESAKSPVVATSPAAKAAAKATAPVKAAAKATAPVKAAAKATAPVKAAAKATAPTAGYPKDVRISVGGTRVRIGKAKDAAHEKKMIAAYKKANA